MKWHYCACSIGTLDGLCYWPLQGLLSSWAAEPKLIKGRARRLLVWLYGLSIHCRIVWLGSWVTGSQKTSCLLLRLPLASSAPAASLFCTRDGKNTKSMSLLTFSVYIQLWVYAGCQAVLFQMSKLSRNYNNTLPTTCIHSSKGMQRHSSVQFSAQQQSTIFQCTSASQTETESKCTLSK